VTWLFSVSSWLPDSWPVMELTLSSGIFESDAVNSTSSSISAASGPWWK
jgi:hypothetical protein